MLAGASRCPAAAPRVGHHAADVDDRAAAAAADARRPISDPCTTPQKLTSNSRRLSASVHLVEAAVDADAGVVHPGVEPAVSARWPRRPSAARRPLRHVGRRPPSPRRPRHDARDDCVQRRPVARGEHELAPRLGGLRAVARPMPLRAPVMTITCSRTGLSGAHSPSTLSASTLSIVIGRCRRRLPVA